MWKCRTSQSVAPFRTDDIGDAPISQFGDDVAFGRPCDERPETGVSGVHAGRVDENLENGRSVLHPETFDHGLDECVRLRHLIGRFPQRLGLRLTVTCTSHSHMCNVSNLFSFLTPVTRSSLRWLTPSSPLSGLHLGNIWFLIP